MKSLLSCLLAGLTFIGFLTPAQAEDYYYPWPEFDTFANHNQWAYRAVRAPQAHQLGVTGQGIKIAILDDGLASTDPKLRDKVIAYKDFVSGRFVEAEHGTMVASTIASDFNAEVGIGGVAPGVSIMVARVCHYNGCEHNAIRQAVAWAVASGADIISESFTGYTDTYMHAMYRSAIEKGVVVVTSMGNSGCRPYYFERLDYGCLDGKIREDTQGRYPIAGLMAVSATDPDDGRVNTSGWGSGWGPNNDIAAPGFETSAYDSFGPSNGFGGTSASAPLVAGVAALILSIKPDLTPAQVQAVIQASARKPVEIKPKVWDSCAKDEQTGKWSCNNIIDSTLPQQYFTGAGIVDAEAAVRLTREIVSGTLIPASEFTQSGKTLTITWPNGPADLYLNSRLVARDVSTGYQYQGYENQSVAIQIRQNNRSSIPTIAMISDPVDVEQPVVYQLWSRNSSDAGLGSGLAIAFEVVHTPTLRDNIWKKVSPWDLEHPEFAGIFEFDDGEIAPCRGSNSPENIYFICPYVKEKLEVSGRFRLIGKDSRLSPYSEVKTALFTKAKQDFPLEVSYLNSGLPVISWQSQPGASSYKYRWQAEYQYFCTTETTFTPPEKVPWPAALHVFAMSDQDCSGVVLGQSEQLNYMPLPVKPAKPTGITVADVSYEMIEFSVPDRPTDSVWRIYRSDGLMIRIYPGQRFIVPVQANEDVNGKTYSYRFAQGKQELWSMSWSELSDPITASFRKLVAPEIGCHSGISRSEVRCDSQGINGTSGTRIEYLDSDFTVLDAVEYRNENPRSRYRKLEVPGASYVRVSATLGEIKNRDWRYRRGESNIRPISPRKSIETVAQIR